MAHRPYPNRDRALAQVRRARPGRDGFRAADGGWRPDFLMDARTGRIVPYPVDAYVVSTR